VGKKRSTLWAFERRRRSTGNEKRLNDIPGQKQNTLRAADRILGRGVSLQAVPESSRSQPGLGIYLIGRASTAASM